MSVGPNAITAGSDSSNVYEYEPSLFSVIVPKFPFKELPTFAAFPFTSVTVMGSPSTSLSLASTLPLTGPVPMSVALMSLIACGASL